MLFPKTTPGISLSALARSKKFWGTPSTSQGSTNPGFFVSTPQFNRHQRTQLVVYVEDGRGTGSSSSTSDSHGIDNPYLALTAGGNGASAAPGLHLDDDSKDDTYTRPANSRPSNRISKNMSLDHTAKLSQEPALDPVVNSDLSQELIYIDTSSDESEKLAIVDSMVEKMRRLHASGSHTAVLATFEVLETVDTALPIDAYNLVLDTLGSTCDVTTLLEAYERMLSRNIKPNDATYIIILNSLLHSAELRYSNKVELFPYLGDSKGSLESVDEIYEGLAIDEYLVLSHTILQAVLEVHTQPWASELQQCLDKVIKLSIRHNIEIPRRILEAGSENLTGLITVQPSLDAAARRFSSLSPDLQNSEDAQVALIETYFKFSQPSGAIAFYSGCGAPNYLLKPLLKGFARCGLVGTARRWVDKTNADKLVVAEVLSSIPKDQNPQDLLPSATELFYKLVGGGDGNGNPTGSSGDPKIISGKCAFIRLCVAAGNKDALYMAIKESHLTGSIWDAVTVTQVISFLANNNEPLLAADICSWQVSQLQLVYKSKNLKSFVDEELVSDTISLLQKLDLLSLDASLRLLPVSVNCSTGRRNVIDIITAAKLGAPYEISELITDERLSMIVSSLAAIMTSSSHRATSEELEILSSIFPLFVEDAITMKAKFSNSDVLLVQDTLNVCNNTEALSKIWNARYLRNESSASKSSPAPASSSSSSSPSLAFKSSVANSENSIRIQRYALSPNGLPMAVSLLKDQVRLKQTVTSDAITAVISACVKNDMLATLKELSDTLPQTQLTLNSLIIAATQLKDLDLSRRFYVSLVRDIGVYPTQNTYLAMIKAQQSNLTEALSLFNEAKLKAKHDLGPEFYNAIVAILSHHLNKSELSQVLAEMQEKNFKLSADSYESIISMHLSSNDGYAALATLKSIPTAMKGLLRVRVYNDLMKYFVEASDRNNSLNVFVELRDSGIMPDPYSYRLLIETYLIRDQVNEPNLERADQVLKLMRRDGAPITTQCFAALLRARGVLFKDFEGARNFYRGLVKNSRVLPDKTIFQALVDSYVLNGKQSELRYVQNEMERYHVPLDRTMMSSIVSSNL